jgi:dipeptidyl aminopeptidase/acylaminoacyl peptidase
VAKRSSRLGRRRGSFLPRLVVLSAVNAFVFEHTLLAFDNAARNVRTAAHAVAPLTIEDCIGATRAQFGFGMDNSNIVFSRDGRQFATVVWRGNLATNLNDYTLLVFDANKLARAPVEVLKISFGYEKDDQNATPISHVQFLDRRIAALVSLHGEPRQVVAIDITKRALVPLTHHSGGVVAFAAAPNAKEVLYASYEDQLDGVRNAAKRVSMVRNGFSLQDKNVIGEVPIYRIAAGDWHSTSNRLRYFLIHRGDSVPHQIYEDPARPKALGVPRFWMAPDGRHAVVYPYVLAAEAEPTFGLVDTTTGTIRRLFSGDYAPRRRGLDVLWSRESKSVVVSISGHNAPTELAQVSLDERKVDWTTISARYDMLGWNLKGDGILLTRGYRQAPDLDGQVNALAMLPRSDKGWGTVTGIDGGFDLNPVYSIGTNGSLIVGIEDRLSIAPEIAAYSLFPGRTTVLTNLNPQLHERALGEVSYLRWQTPFDKKTSVGYLVKPIGFLQGRQYPLVIQWIDLYYSPDNNSFVLDEQVGSGQYNGVAAQVWANEGLMTLLTPFPFVGSDPVQLTPEEGPHMVAHIQNAVDLLDSQGLIDRTKIAIAGWSWAGAQTEYVLTHSNMRFAAAATTDNYEFNILQFTLNVGSSPQWNVFWQAWQGQLPWGAMAQAWWEQSTDEKYDKVNSPWLIEVHGSDNATLYAETYAALKVVKTPVEFYLYPDAPHAVKSPLHRLNSLSTHTDWFRFWLQGYEDTTVAKQSQYARWRQMRSDWKAAHSAK